MKTLSEKVEAAFLLYSRLMAHEPQANPWHTANKAFDCTNAFFEVLDQRLAEKANDPR